MSAPESQPHPVDYRWSLAAERTYLAYLRTGLALTAAGLAIAVALPAAPLSALRRGIGVTLVAAGAAVFAMVRPRWLAVQRAMERGEPLPQIRLVHTFGFVFAAAAVAVAIVALVA